MAAKTILVYQLLGKAVINERCGHIRATMTSIR